MTIVVKDFIGLSRVNYTYMAFNQNKFVLPNLTITVNLSKCKKALCFLCKGKKASHDSFYENKWFLDSSVSTHFTHFESNFVDMTLYNYSQVEITNSKAPLFIVTSSTVPIEYEIIYPAKGTTKVAVSYSKYKWVITFLDNYFLLL